MNLFTPDDRAALHRRVRRLALFLTCLCLPLACGFAAVHPAARRLKPTPPPLAPATVPHLAQSPTQLSPQIGVFYTAWWDEEDKFKHWSDARDRVKMTPTLGHYSGNDPIVIRAQYRAMRECGVDFVVMDDTNTLFVDDGIINRNIRAWFDFMDALPADQRLPICIAFGGELNQHADRDSFLKAADSLWQQFAQRPSYFRLDGKPLALWYIEKDVLSDWTDARFTVRRCYHFLRTPDQGRTQGWGWGALPYPPDNTECMSLMPGWQLGNDPGVPRRGGDFYMESWLRVLKAHPRFTLLTDWNNWQEQTSLEDSSDWKDSYGYSTPNWYRQITTAYAALRARHFLSGAYYRAEGETSVYYCSRAQVFVHVPAYPHRKPVILVPTGWMDALPKHEWSGSLEPG